MASVGDAYGPYGEGALVPDDNSAVTISEAAEALHLTVEGVRQRIRRKKLAAYKAPDGTWRVVLTPPNTEPNGKQGSVGSADGPTYGDGYKELTAHLAQEIAFLRDEMGRQREDMSRQRDQWAEESRRKDVIIAELTQQLKALPAQVKEEVEATTPPPPAPRRSWWQRLWGIE